MTEVASDIRDHACVIVVKSEQKCAEKRRLREAFVGKFEQAEKVKPIGYGIGYGHRNVVRDVVSYTLVSGVAIVGQHRMDEKDEKGGGDQAPSPKDYVLHPGPHIVDLQPKRQDVV